MRFFLLLAAVSGVSSTITDLNCTIDGNYAPNALSCENTISQTACDTFVGTTVLTAGTNTNDRAAKCYQDSTNAPSEDMKQAIIKMCPKSCGYCCLTSAYACKNKEFPGVKCETVTTSQCVDPQWRVILASECPATCGLCDQGGCVDAVIQCKNDLTICRNIDMQAFVKVNCAKTCGFCANNSTTTAYPGSSTCLDKGTNCASWVQNGFCINPFYTTVQKQSYCARSCGLC